MCGKNDKLHSGFSFAQNTGLGVINPRNKFLALPFTGYISFFKIIVCLSFCFHVCKINLVSPISLDFYKHMRKSIKLISPVTH